MDSSRVSQEREAADPRLTPLALARNAQPRHNGAVLGRYLAACCIVAFHVTACGGQAYQEQTRGDSQIPDDSPEADAPSMSDNTGASEPPPVPASDSDTPSTSQTDPLPADTECYVPEARPIPTRDDCAPTAVACQPSSETCLLTPLAVTLQNLLFESCDLYCGELAIGTSQGCITLVENPADNVSDFECVRQHLLGTRWECAPSDGMARVYLGSCTLR